MGQVTLNGGSNLGTSLQTFLMCDEIVPGASPSYEVCKVIYSYHPLGAKLAENPIRIAQSQEREISVPAGPDAVLEAFKDEWKRIGADHHIFNVMRQARIYGIASIAVLADGVAPADPIDYSKLHSLSISFNVLDPLNTAGSLVLNQNPNALDYQKHGAIAIAGVPYHRSRAVVMMNEDPLYIQYTSSAFGFVGRSVYQRALFPLKSFIQSMVTDDMVTRKAGLLIAMIKQAGSIVDNVMKKLFAGKRDLLKDGVTNNVLSVGHEDKIETLNMQNLDGAYGMARKNVIENIASAASMPALLINHETFAEGFGEGTEDAKYVAQYVDDFRRDMQPLYDFFDRIVRYRAWSPTFYKSLQRRYPEEYGSVEYEVAFYEWSTSFKAIWPSLLREPDSERVKVDDVKLKAIIALVEVLLPAVDPDNKAIVIQWVQDNLNTFDLLFDSPLELDTEALKSYVPPEPLAEPAPSKPFAAADGERPALRAYEDAVARLMVPARAGRDKVAA